MFFTFGVDMLTVDEGILVISVAVISIQGIWAIRNSSLTKELVIIEFENVILIFARPFADLSNITESFDVVHGCHVGEDCSLSCMVAIDTMHGSLVDCEVRGLETC
jgi:hypothetical protein